MGGNNPPEYLDEAPLARELMFVWEPLEDLESEISKDVPDPKRLKRIISSLSGAIKVGLIWALKKGDLAVDTGIKWAVPAGATSYLALNPDKLEAVVNAAKRFLATF